mmetsp:Transcript_89961/g.160114  ORF Transcript_89961/g.160114 Transcript_89961/m.160114 type:complete len:666 (-) Transcript_89961:167-2164(-)|eukprot:CAMPEP_0197664542 /NCGR_PEP_ID=MMETSP1338-20131121/58700_1 /TAXON_ID=43686 ORGANISM="Pelagodinium beii, Strain RCC1491" /NCGR_SAMPLE_ID=MMETSP1338 /ASSEMBLY_ACC=CAM_ASM_000754 /LENGTH=665 /DNA_ID=CAMNT_0043243209 /DNA_START=35 /DNA_END=2032 /DNA_ORIENTATION=+
MVPRLALLAVLVVAVTSLTLDASDGARSRPVTKVVKLLKGMQASLETELKEDEETHEKMTCWCKSNTEEKTKSIEEAETRIKALQGRVAELSATGSRLTVEIEHLKGEIAENKGSMDTATALRKTQVSEFHNDEKDLLDSVGSVGGALETLSPGDGSFLQIPKARIAGAAAKLKALVERHPKLLSAEQREKVEELVLAPLQRPAFLQQKIGPEDGEGAITGVLTGLKDDFSHQLESLHSQEKSDKIAFESLTKAKGAEIEAGRTQLEAKQEQKASANLEAVEAKQDIEDTTASLNADTELLAQVKERCGGMDVEFEKRRQMRTEEIAAVVKATEVLDNDEAHDSFSKTFSFLQASSINGQRERAAAMLSEASKTGGARLTTLSLMMKLDSFEKVKKAIESMVTDLKTQQKDEVKQKDWCGDELAKNQLQVQGKTQEKESKSAELATMTSSTSQLDGEIKSLGDEVTEMQKQIQLASQNREKENKEFQTTVTEQRQTQTLLQQALTVLKAFYEKPQESLVETKNEMEPAPEFKAFKQSSGNFGVMSMLQQLVADAKAMEAEATFGEKKAQEDYEAFAKSTTAAVEAKNKSIGDKSEEKAEFEASLVQAKEAKEGVASELQQLSQESLNLHESCDFVLQNFDSRQSAREDEIDALRQAEAMLSGAKA